MAPTFGPDWSASLARADPGDREAWLEFAMAACDLGDEIALASFEKGITADQKADGSFVTEADRAIERLIRSRLADRFPTHGVLGEEYGESAGANVRWFLDPIDGTHNFMRGVPLFGTLLAVESDGEIQVGVLSAPALGQRWFASRGTGAWATRTAGDDRRRLRVSAESSVARMQLLYRSIRDMHAARVSAGFDALVQNVWRERGFGDFWGYTLVAGGSAEAMVEGDLGPWDLAAPSILVEEAGGRITDFDGVRSFAHGESLATNGLLHDELLDHLWGRRSGEIRPVAR